MTTNTTRRSLLRASPALLGSGLLASTALAQLPPTVEDPHLADTPILRLFREWDGIQADMVTCPDDHVDALCDTSSSLERRMLAEPSTGALDLAAKVIASSCYGDFPVEPEVIRESEQLLGVSRPTHATSDVATEAGAGALVAPPSPVLALFREHEDLIARMELPSTSAEEFDELYPRYRDLAERISAEPARSAADLAAKVLALTQIKDSPDTTEAPALVAECEALVARALA